MRGHVPRKIMLLKMESDHFHGKKGRYRGVSKNSKGRSELKIQQVRTCKNRELNPWKVRGSNVEGSTGSPRGESWEKGKFTEWEYIVWRAVVTINWKKKNPIRGQSETGNTPRRTKKTHGPRLENSQAETGVGVGKNPEGNARRIYDARRIKGPAQARGLKTLERTT